MGENCPMQGTALPDLPIDKGVNLRTLNAFGLPAVAHTLVRVRSDAEVRRLVDHPELGRAPKFVLGGGSNVVFTRDPQAVIVKVEVNGRREWSRPLPTHNPGQTDSLDYHFRIDVPERAALRVRAATRVRGAQRERLVIEAQEQ